jgi:hypothetical protein
MTNGGGCNVFDWLRPKDDVNRKKIIMRIIADETAAMGIKYGRNAR